MVEAKYTVGVQPRNDLNSRAAPHESFDGRSRSRRTRASASQRVSPRAELWAFTGPWDRAQRLESPRERCALWTPPSPVGSDSTVATGAADSSVAVCGHAASSRSGPKRMALVTSWHGDRFHPSSVRTLAHDDARLARAAGADRRPRSGDALRRAGARLRGAQPRPTSRRSCASSKRSPIPHTHDTISPVVVAIPAADTAAYPARQIVDVADARDADALRPALVHVRPWADLGPGLGSHHARDAHRRGRRVADRRGAAAVWLSLVDEVEIAAEDVTSPTRSASRRRLASHCSATRRPERFAV